MVDIKAVTIEDGRIKIIFDDEAKNIKNGAIQIVSNKAYGELLGDVVADKAFYMYVDNYGMEYVEEILNKMVQYLVANTVDGEVQVKDSDVTEDVQKVVSKDE